MTTLPSTLDPDIANLLTMLNSSGLSLAGGTVEQARAMIRMMNVDMLDPAILAEVASVEAITVADSIPARVYRPATTGPVPTIVFYHGGGFVIGDLDTHDPVCRLLCRDVEAVVVSVDYRLAPEHVFPAAVLDAYASLQWVIAHIEDFGADAARVAVGGDSAGGNLSAVVAQLAHTDNLPLALQLLVYPAVDMLGEYQSRIDNAEGFLLTQSDMVWFGQHYLGMAEDDPAVAVAAEDPRLSPLKATSLAGLAPAIVVTAEFDPLRDEGNLYADELTAAGVAVTHRQFPGLIHGFYGLEALGAGSASATAWINTQVKDILG
jgi:acetyl esterase